MLPRVSVGVKLARAARCSPFLVVSTTLSSLSHEFCNELTALANLCGTSQCFVVRLMGSFSRSGAIFSHTLSADLCRGTQFRASCLAASTEGFKTQEKWHASPAIMSLVSHQSLSCRNAAFRHEFWCITRNP